MILLLAALMFQGVIPPSIPTMLTTAGIPGITTLSWEDNTNPAGTTYNIYRSQGSCGSGQVAGPALATNVPSLVDDNDQPVFTFVDRVVSQFGNYCYAVTAVLNGVESGQSGPEVAYVAPPFPVTLTVTTQ